MDSIRDVNYPTDFRVFCLIHLAKIQDEARVPANIGFEFVMEGKSGIWYTSPVTDWLDILGGQCCLGTFVLNLSTGELNVKETHT